MRVGFPSPRACFVWNEFKGKVNLYSELGAQLARFHEITYGANEP